MSQSREIQGLRALAVLSVIIFHFQVFPLSGGYLGVDIFFVISGYLMSQMIQRDLNLGEFSLERFYKNRAIRLFPNLALMIFTSVIVSFFVLGPHDFVEYSKSLQFSGLYVTNMVFARQQGYFDISRELKPLLHTWSLSIEEQFYLFFPLVIMVLSRFKKIDKLVFFFLVILSSMLYKSYLIEYHPFDSFYSFPGRIWELALGASFYFYHVRYPKAIKSNDLISMVALVILLSSLIFLSEEYKYAGIASLACCISTGFLICSSSDTWIGKFLSNKPFFFIGNISYSLYLWHWLVLVAFRNLPNRLPYNVELWGMIVSTIVIAYLAYVFIEQPIRLRRNTITARKVLIGAIAFSGINAAIGGYIYAKDGMEWRFPQWEEVEKNVNSFNWQNATGQSLPSIGECLLSEDTLSIASHCILGDRNGNQTILLIGDSHKAALQIAFDVAAKYTHTKIITTTVIGCPPLLGIKSLSGPKNICEPVNFEEKLKKLIQENSFKAVYFVNYWSMYSDGSRFMGALTTPTHFLSDEKLESKNAQDSQRVMKVALYRTIKYLEERHIETILVEDVPVLPNTIRSLPKAYTQKMKDVYTEQRFMKEFLENYRKEKPLRSIELSKGLCEQDQCLSYLNENYLYTDQNHVSQAGAARLIPIIQNELQIN